MYDCRLLDRIKEAFCHLNLDHCGPVEGRFVHSPPGQPPKAFSLKVNDEAMITVLGAFTPELLALTGPKGCHLHTPQISDPHDPHDDLYILQTQRKRGDAEFDEGDDDDGGLPSELKDPVRPEAVAVPPTTNPARIDALQDKADESPQLRKSSSIPTRHVVGVSSAILQSVDRCESEEVKRKMLSQILLVGGGLAYFPGVTTWLRNRLAVQMPIAFRGKLLPE